MEVVVASYGVVVGDDFNAWIVEWRSTFTNARPWLSRMSGFAAMIWLAHSAETTAIDVTFCSPSLTEDMNCIVSEEYSNSDH